MIVLGEFSFNNGKEKLLEKNEDLYFEILNVIKSVNAPKCKTKQSKEKTRRYEMLYSPSCLNKEFKKEFNRRDWTNYKINCDYPIDYYINGYYPKKTTKGAYRDMDFVKKRVGVEVQFGKYAFMVYNVCAKMTIFHNLDVIDVGVEIVPIKELANEMSTGVSYFEQFIWDLEKRGESNIDIPVLILGIGDKKHLEQKLSNYL